MKDTSFFSEKVDRKAWCIGKWLRFKVQVYFSFNRFCNGLRISFSVSKVSLQSTKNDTNEYSIKAFKKV